MEEGYQFKGRLFHGTDRDLKPGDEILPGDVTGNAVFRGFADEHGQRAQGHAFAADDEREAWHYAYSATVENGGRGRVYEVEAHPEMSKGTNNPYEWKAPSFRVKDQIDVEPPSGDHGYTYEERAGRQGTIPGYDWSTNVKFYGTGGLKKRENEMRYEINHPPAPVDPKTRQRWDDSAENDERRRRWTLRPRSRWDPQLPEPDVHPGQQALIPVTNIPLKMTTPKKR